MDNDLFERRLRAALRAEADRLPLTITPAELERRARVHGRVASSRFTLLLAAALAIGALGATAIIAGLSNKPAPSPVADASASPSATTGPTSAAGAAILPTLDEMIGADPSDVLAAQAWGPADSPGTPVLAALEPGIPIASLRDIRGRGDYDISVACLGKIPLEVSITPTTPGATVDGPRFTCDGRVHDETVTVNGPAGIDIWYRDTTSYRVVVRGTHAFPPTPTTDPVLPNIGAADGAAELVRVDDATVDPNSPTWGASGLRVQPIGAIPGRAVFGATVWCDAGATIRLLFADEIGGVLTPAIETVLACDGLAHDLGLPLPLPAGSPVYVAADPATHWSVVISSGQPFGLAADIAGWQQEGGVGPSLHFEDTEISFSGAVGDNGVPLLFLVQCAGPAQDIDVAVDAEGILGDDFKHDVATCTPEGASTSWTFDTSSTGYLVRHAAPAGTWTSLTLLSPTTLPIP